MFDVKYSGFWGYYYLSPYNGDDTPGWYDVDEQFYAVNSYYFYKADRVRHQANATLTKFASGYAGEHNLKFGAEFERSYIKSEQGYPGGMYVLASFGEPYYAYLWDGYLKDNINNRLSAFAQDSWTIGSRLTINPGVRFDRITGNNSHLDEQVFATNSISPRIGFAWDVAGDSKTVVRGHYGWYFDGAKSSYYDLLDPRDSAVLRGLYRCKPGRHGGSVPDTAGHEPDDGSGYQASAHASGHHRCRARDTSRLFRRGDRHLAQERSVHRRRAADITVGVLDVDARGSRRRRRARDS